MTKLKVVDQIIIFFFNLFLFMAVLGLRFCARAFSICGKWGPLFIAARGPLTVAASLVAEHGLQTRRLSSRGSRAQLLRGMRDPPRSGLEPVSPALAGRLSTTAPQGKPLRTSFVLTLPSKATVSKDTPKSLPCILQSTEHVPVTSVSPSDPQSFLEESRGAVLLPRFQIRKRKT